LLGRNGSGKSSIFRMIVGMESITVGSIHIKGYSLKTRPKDASRHVGFCPRELMLLSFMTGKDALRFCCLINGIRREYIKSLVASLAECFELVPHMNKRISTYSNGTKRKLMIAMGTLAPSLMCLDEPTAGVDMHAKYEIWSILDGIRQGGRSILLTTHNLEECEFLCTNVGIMDHGSLLCYGSLSRLKHRFNMGIFVKVKMGTRAEMDDERDNWLVFHYLVLGTAIFAVLPIVERRSKVQHQQFSSGMSRSTYWLSHLSWDYCFYIAMILPLIVVAGITIGSVLPVIVQLLAFGFSAISFTYLLCLMSNDFGKMFSIILYINMIGNYGFIVFLFGYCKETLFPGVLALFIHPKSPQTRYAVIESVLLVHPHYSLCCGMYEAIRTSTFSLKQLPYLIFSGAAYLTIVVFAWVPRRLNYVFKLCLDQLCSSFMLTDYQLLFRSIRNEKIYPSYKDEDKEVDKMRRRLAYLTTAHYAFFPLILKNLSKRYGSFVAVRSLTLDLNP